jgi:arylformamidase
VTEYIDITRPVTSDMVSWPGRLPPEHSWEKTIARGHHCNASFWKMSAHSGTHMDSPLHFVDGGQPIDQISPEVFIGACTVVDLTSHGCSTMGEDVTDQYLGTQRLLIRTQHSESSPHGEYLPHDALLTPEAASILIESGVRLIGTDRLSVDDSQGDDFSIHHLLLGAGCVIVEGLDLADVQPDQYSLIATPLRLTGTEASPIRALLQTT